MNSNRKPPEPSFKINGTGSELSEAGTGNPHPDSDISLKEDPGNYYDARVHQYDDDNEKPGYYPRDSPHKNHRKKLVIYLADLVILSAAFLLSALYKPQTANYISGDYLVAFGLLTITWTCSSFYFRKFDFGKKIKMKWLVGRILMSNFVSLGIILVIITLMWYSGFSRIMLFGTVGLATLLELLAGNLYHSLIQTKPLNGYNTLNPPAKAFELQKARVARRFPKSTPGSDIIRDAVVGECGEQIYMFMLGHVDEDCNRTLFISTGSRFNIDILPYNGFQAIVNMKRVNDVNYINKFFETVNRKLPRGGTFIGCAETKDLRKKRIMKKYPSGLNIMVYFFDYLLKRVFPKFILTKKIYFLLTRGHNRVISRAELLGRLYSCGFKVLDEELTGNLYCFVAQKIKDPVYDLNPTYGPFIKLNRIGKEGRIIRVYKFRTMHPYSEYLQEFMYENNNLEQGGKYKDDFRVTTLGRLMRAFWIDELPMLFNMLKGDVKLVGVRPLSPQYFSLYDTDLQDRRVMYKPGLVPPFYSDLPKTLEEIQDSERRYLDAFERNRLLTDSIYFFRAFRNIVFKNARSS